MRAHSLIWAWGWRLAMSAVTTLVTLAPPAVAPRAVVGGTVLVLAGVKARLILTQYLGLRASPFWRGSFTLAVSIFLLAAFALYLAGTGAGK